jgi:hypothetical protein
VFTSSTPIHHQIASLPQFIVKLSKVLQHVGYGRPPVEHQFKPGNPGRPKGSRNKFGEAFIQALADDFERHGTEVIERVRIEKPEALSQGHRLAVAQGSESERFKMRPSHGRAVDRAA